MQPTVFPSSSGLRSKSHPLQLAVRSQVKNPAARAPAHARRALARSHRHALLTHSAPCCIGFLLSLFDLRNTLCICSFHPPTSLYLYIGFHLFVGVRGSACSRRWRYLSRVCVGGSLVLDLVGVDPRCLRSAETGEGRPRGLLATCGPLSATLQCSRS